MEHTDLENKLFGYIRFLLGLINTYELAVKYLYDGYKSVSEWTVRSFDEQSKSGSIISMIEDLNKEFNSKFVLTLDQLNYECINFMPSPQH